MLNLSIIPSLWRSGRSDSMKKLLFALGAVSLLFGWIHATTLIAIAQLAIFAFGKVEFSS
jgi:uncharacterized membrane protein